jgi:Protein of unknown function (DUF3551)
LSDRRSQQRHAGRRTQDAREFELTLQREVARLVVEMGTRIPNSFQLARCAVVIFREGVLKMRMFTLASLAAGAVMAASPARAQTYSPDYPVCLHVWGRGASYYECAYNSMPQCNASASGRSAQCVVNPYFAYGQPQDGGYRRHRRVHQVY